MQDEPNLVDSPLNETLEAEGHAFTVSIYRLEAETTWTLEVVNEAGTSFVWDKTFETDAQALSEAKQSFKDEGVGAFLG